MTKTLSDAQAKALYEACWPAGPGWLSLDESAKDSYRRTVRDHNVLYVRAVQDVRRALGSFWLSPDERLAQVSAAVRDIERQQYGA